MGCGFYRGRCIAHPIASVVSTDSRHCSYCDANAYCLYIGCRSGLLISIMGSAPRCRKQVSVRPVAVLGDHRAGFADWPIDFACKQGAYLDVPLTNTPDAAAV